MYAVVRTYSGQGASELLDLLGQRDEDVKALISGVQASSTARRFAVVTAA
jgi:hypothetical protein